MSSDHPLSVSFRRSHEVTRPGSAVQSDLTVRWLLSLPPILVATAALPVSFASIDAAILLIAFTLGWTVIVGPCGCAHVGAFCSVGSNRGNRGLWFRMTAVYTIAGMMSGAFVGMLLGTIGSRGFRFDAWWLAIVAVGLLCLTRESGLLALPLPERKRQTRWKWFSQRPGPANAAMWGLDVGLVFATWLTFSGAWLLATLALLSGNPTLGGLIFACYWMGRAVPHWIDRGRVHSSREVVPFIASVRDLHPAMQRIHAYALGMCILMITIWALS